MNHGLSLLAWHLCSKRAPECFLKRHFISNYLFLCVYVFMCRCYCWCVYGRQKSTLNVFFHPILILLLLLLLFLLFLWLLLYVSLIFYQFFMIFLQCVLIISILLPQLIQDSILPPCIYNFVYFLFLCLFWNPLNPASAVYVYYWMYVLPKFFGQPTWS